MSRSKTYDLSGLACTVSILIPMRNAEKVIERALGSIQDQTFANWEAIVVDDGSHDASVRKVQALAQVDSRITLHTTPQNHGAAAARNLALQHARGRFIAFLDADDAWHPDKLTRQLAFMQHHDTVLSYTDFIRITRDQSHRVKVPETVTYHQLLRGNCIGCLTAMYDRARIGSVAMPELRMRQDYALWLKILSQGAVAHGLNEPLATYHATPHSLSSNKVKATLATWRMYRNHLNLGPVKSLWYILSHMARRLRRG